MNFKKMGVINLTPNSFSDGGEVTPDLFLQKIESLAVCDALDFGAESTAPFNQAISWELEWERISPYLNLIKKLPVTLSLDTYHPETIEAFLRFYHDEKMKQNLIWNDVSGKFDENVRDFLKRDDKFWYVFCHNLSPVRELTSSHMDYLDPNLSLKNLIDYFLPFKKPRVIFDPCLGFSKTYEQNWMILNNWQQLLSGINHQDWLIGFSRKSFLRKKYSLEIHQREELDLKHDEVIKELQLCSNIWVRAHRFHV
jgi:dihydropteroate synthase